ncbi:hypothetical protein HAX54_041783, partial [Datura stramonium]|nr:hypothetical protein [Datura stramonium]
MLSKRKKIDSDLREFRVGRKAPHALVHAAVLVPRALHHAAVLVPCTSGRTGVGS